MCVLSTGVLFAADNRNYFAVRVRRRRANSSSSIRTAPTAVARRWIRITAVYRRASTTATARTLPVATTSRIPLSTAEIISRKSELSWSAQASLSSLIRTTIILIWSLCRAAPIRISVVVVVVVLYVVDGNRRWNRRRRVQLVAMVTIDQLAPIGG